MLLVSTLAPETIGKDEVLPGSFAGSWALLCLATSSWEGKYHPLLPGLPTKDRASGINLLDYSQNTRIFFFPQPSGKNEVASFCVSEVRRENIIGDFFLPLTNQRNGEADSRSSVPLQEHHWATHYKKSRIPSGATSKRTCFPSSLILCVEDCFPIYALIYPRDLSRVSRAAFSLANPPVGHRSFGGEGWRRKRATEWGRLLSPSTPCSPFVSLAQ